VYFWLNRTCVVGRDAEFSIAYCSTFFVPRRNVGQNFIIVVIRGNDAAIPISQEMTNLRGEFMNQELLGYIYHVAEMMD
jgi:hypothetical protein